jgi:hypothetical protein
LKHTCLKWACIAHLDIWNTSYDQKKGRESKWQFNSQPLKVRNRPDFLACKWCATYRWKALNEGYNFALDFIAIGGLHAKLYTPKVAEVLVVGILKRRKYYKGQKAIWMWPPWRNAENTIKGEGGGFPQVRTMLNLVNPSCPWFVLAPKVLQLCTNHLMLVFNKFVWVIEACQFFLVPSRNSSTPLYPCKVLRARERALTLYSFVVFNLDSHLSPSRSWEHVTIATTTFAFIVGIVIVAFHAPFITTYTFSLSRVSYA